MSILARKSMGVAMMLLTMPCVATPHPVDGPTPHVSGNSDDATDLVAARTDASLRMTVLTRIRASGPYRFMVDTGAQNTVVSDDLATRLALSRGRQATVIGVAGHIVVDTVTLNGLTLGRRTFDHLVAPVLASADIGADGIVGLDTLQDQRIVIDFPHNRIAIGDAADEGGDRGYEIVVRARRRSGQLIITTARIDGVPVDVVLDTGADTTVGNRALQHAFARRKVQVTSTIESVTGQSLPVDMLIARRMLLGPLELQNVSIAYADAPPFGQLGLGKRPAILLGMSELRAFKRVAIDFRQRKVLFDVRSQAERR